jgi:hypothetical protein
MLRFGWMSIILAMSNPAWGAVAVTPVAIGPTPYTVGIGRGLVLKANADVVSASSANSAVCSVVVSPDKRSIILTGVRAGATTVTLLFDPSTSAPETSDIQVGRLASECQQVADFVKQQFPKSNVTVSPIPASSKVILRGNATSAYQHRRIREIIEAMIPRADIIDMLTCNCSCYVR